MENEVFEFVRGRTYERDFTIIGYDKEIDKMLFTVCNNEDDKNYILRKTLDDGITLTDTGETEEGESYMDFNLLIKATDTDKMKTNKEYPFDITLYSGEDKTEVMSGILTLKGASTKTCNE